MADIFVSYTSSDRTWAFWIGRELEALGHVPHLHEWEISGGANFVDWMNRRLGGACHALLVVSQDYLAAKYCVLEWGAAVAHAANNHLKDFIWPVFIERCEAPALLAPFVRCDLYGLGEPDARARLAAYVAPAAKPAGPVPFPGRPDEQTAAAPVAFPGRLSNIPFAVPRHFLGRDDALAAIDAALNQSGGRVAIAALHGLRGVGKTTLAAAYAELRRDAYRATWWVQAQTPEAMRRDLVALGVRLGWAAADAKDDAALADVLERLRDEGEGLLLIYDNAADARSLAPFLPRGGAARILVTSNAPDWRKIAAPVEIRVWPKATGADFLIRRTGRAGERAEAEGLSETLGGLPLAHEQAAAYVEAIGVSIADYRRLFEAAPDRCLGDDAHAPVEHNDGETVAKAFALAIDEATKRHPAAEALIVHAALLAQEPIPLFLFAEGREALGAPLAAELAGDGLGLAIAALRAFALVERETIVDERDAGSATDSIRLHRLVRLATAGRCQSEARAKARHGLIEAVAKVYPKPVYNSPQAWPRARRLDALALALLPESEPPPAGAEATAAYLLNALGEYRHGALADRDAERRLFERALAIRETTLGPDHLDTAESQINLAIALQDQGDLDRARTLFERSLATRETALGPEHPDTAVSLNNLGLLLQDQGDLASARTLFERALAIREKTLGAAHSQTAVTCNNLGRLLLQEGDFAGARALITRAVEIWEKALGPEHPWTAYALDNLAALAYAQGDLAGARPIFERVLAIREKAVGPDHPDTASARANLAQVRLSEGAPAEALALAEPALAAQDKALGPGHAWTKGSAAVTAAALDALGRGADAAAVRARHGLGGEAKG